LGYEDELLTMSEVFRLWAIQGDEKVKETLCFSKSDEGVIINAGYYFVQGVKIAIAEWYSYFQLRACIPERI
jgi:tagaturonate reductase